MSIFISRFSPERSMVGNFLAPRVRQTGGTDAADRPRSTRPAQGTTTGANEDRVELSQSQPATASQAPAQTTPAAEAKATPSQDTTEAAAAGADPSTAAPTSNRTGLAAGRALLNAASAASESEGSSLANLVLAIREENGAAAETAEPSRLDALVSALDEADAGEATAETAAAADVPEAEGAADEAAATPPVVVPPQADPVQPPVAREVQEQELQRDLQTIASGLRADAAIESRLNVEETARHTQAATARGQQNEVRENQSEIQSLQTDRRQLQQEAQNADRAIRQLQTRNARLQGGSNGPSGPGSTLDLLAQ